MNQQLIKLIELCLIDGVISDKERSVIFRKSEELGISKDECEIILEGMIQKHSKKNTPQPQKKKGFFGSIMDEVKKGVDEVKKNVDVDSITDKVKSIQEEYEKKVEEVTNQNQSKRTSSSKTSKPKSTTPKKVSKPKPTSSKPKSTTKKEVSKPKPTPSKPKKTTTKSSTSKKRLKVEKTLVMDKKLMKGNSIKYFKEKEVLFSIDFFDEFYIRNKSNKLVYESWLVKKDEIKIFKLDKESYNKYLFLKDPSNFLVKKKVGTTLNHHSTFFHNSFTDKPKMEYIREYHIEGEGDTIETFEDKYFSDCKFRYCYDNDYKKGQVYKIWNDRFYSVFGKKYINRFNNTKLSYTLDRTINIGELKQLDFKIDSSPELSNSSNGVRTLLKSGKDYEIPYTSFEIITGLKDYEKKLISIIIPFFEEKYKRKDEEELYFTQSFLKLKVLIEKGYDDYSIYTEEGLKSSQRGDLVQFEKGETSLILDFDIYYQILKNNQEKIIKKDDLYIQKFIKLNNYLKEKYQNLDSILIRLNKSIKVRGKEDYFRNEREINFFKGLVYSYNLLVNHSIVMVTSLVENDMITFYEIYEIFDKMNVFNTNWENEVNNNLSEINESLVDMRFTIKGLMNQMRGMERNIVNGLQSINTSIGSLENSVNKQLSETNSRLKYQNLTSYYSKSTLKGSWDWFDGP